MPITRMVGRAAPNLAVDVATVQQYLARHAKWVAPAVLPSPNGVCDDVTIRAIIAFQEGGAALLKGDGQVSPHGFTIRRLEMPFIPAPSHAVFSEKCWGHPGGPVTDAAYAAAAKALDCEVNAIKAVAETETKREPWDDVGRPTILFERHKFAKHSGNAFNATHPDIANTSAGGYGKFSAQYPKLRRAAILNEEAALKSASWGKFQILGENHADCGFVSVADLVTAMMESEQRHLDAFVAFIQSNLTMHKALKAKDWATFARHYNGPDYKKNDYDTNMAGNYAKLAGPKAPAPAKH